MLVQSRLRAYPAPMGWWVPRAPTTPDEQVTFEALANLFQGWRGVGGKITVTTLRLLFTPNWFDAATGGKAMVLDRVKICGVEVVRGSQSPVRMLGIAPFPRPLVRVDHADGPTYFLLNKPDRLTTALENLS
jgi:hypothetical protein